MELVLCGEAFHCSEKMKSSAGSLVNIKDMIIPGESFKATPRIRIDWTKLICTGVDSVTGYFVTSMA